MNVLEWLFDILGWMFWNGCFIFYDECFGMVVLFSMMKTFVLEWLYFILLVMNVLEWLLSLFIIQLWWMFLKWMVCQLGIFIHDIWMFWNGCLYFSYDEWYFGMVVLSFYSYLEMNVLECWKNCIFIV